MAADVALGPRGTGSALDRVGACIRLSPGDADPGFIGAAPLPQVAGSG